MASQKVKGRYVPVKVDRRMGIKTDRYAHVNWSKRDRDIAAELGVTRAAVQDMRRRWGKPEASATLRNIAEGQRRRELVRGWMEANAVSLHRLSLREILRRAPCRINDRHVLAWRKELGIIPALGRGVQISLENLRDYVSLDPTSGCWEWLGSCYANGYATIHDELGHRYVYKLRYGDISAGHQVRHTCDNPPCVCPDHVILGTSTQNMQDRSDRGRTARGKKLDWGKVRQIRKLYSGTRDMRPLAEQFGVCPEMIFRIASGKSWKEA